MLTMSRKILVLFLFLLSLFFVLHSLLLSHMCDDAYISFRYARNFASGWGLVFNPGEKVEGYTNFLWVVILAGFQCLGLDIVAAAKVLGIFFALALLWVLPFSAWKVRGEGGWMDLLAPALLACNGSFSFWAGGGMETLMFSCWLFLALFSHLRYQMDGKGLSLILFSILFGLAALTRPEGLPLFLVAFLYHLFLLARGKDRKAGFVLFALLPFLAIIIPHFAWRWSYYGYPLPNSFYAKTGDWGVQVQNGLVYLYGFLTAYGGPLLFAPLLLLFRFPSVVRSLSLILLIVACFSGYIVVIGGDWMVYHRFFTPILPLIFFLVQESLRAALPLLRRTFFPAQESGKKWGVLLASFLFLLLLFDFLPSLHWNNELFDADRSAVSDYFEVGEKLKEILPGDASLALGSVGIIPYITGLKTYDILGITDAHIAHREMDFLTTYPGHGKTDGPYLLQKRPTCMLLGNVDITPAPRRRSHLFPVRGPEREIFGQGDFASLYELRSVKLPSGRFLNFFMRKEGRE